MRNHVCNNYYISLEDYADEDFCFDYYPVNRVPVGRGTRRTRHHKDEDEYLESEIMSKPRPRKMSKYEANSSTSGIEETKNRKDIWKISSDWANKWWVSTICFILLYSLWVCYLNFKLIFELTKKADLINSFPAMFFIFSWQFVFILKSKIVEM